MKIAYFDCIAGASGDMILGALLDAGLEEATLRERLAALRLKDFDLQSRRVDKNGFQATKVDVIVQDDAPERHLSDIERIIRESALPSAVQEQAMAIFRRLCEVEAGIHGSSPERVHLHELGGVDTIVDVVGALVGLDALGITRVYASPLPLGRGFTQGAHGQIPLPAPATVALLEGIPVKGSELEMELVTPTGAALLTALAADFGSIPAMTLTSVGYGAGSRDLPIPNVLRVLVGERPASGDALVETLVLLETNVDDMNPEIYDHLMRRLVEAGALDVFLSPIQMKKNRPATMVHVLCSMEHVETAKAILFAETTTLGVRQTEVTRHALARSVETVETPYGAVRVKVACWGQGETKSAPEYEDCRLLAEKHDVPLREIYRAVERSQQGDEVSGPQ
jgi:pyridinium-3,5-bisthiocarboxylic acid mononucleotide nickel chelatase